jgi:hypothetical protein
VWRGSLRLLWREVALDHSKKKTEKRRKEEKKKRRKSEQIYFLDENKSIPFSFFFFLFSLEGM